MNDFILHSKLAADTFEVLSLEVSQLLLMNDARYPWLILVPQVSGMRDLHNLSTKQYQAVTQEIVQVSEVVESLAQAHKMNVGALGNMVPQLHIHIIARQTNDAAWPAPVWGVGEAQPYSQDAAKTLIQQIASKLR
ncbi:MAG: HIT domain-containing protein [Gammaproteobacteria bacterium]|jgi:diadenosine tetraphosphate (Ap4A) HIT family hydrolase|nr:HIT domain-containing protein [Gammaproteobacteria bacterium]MBT3695989.1 HIT domain-containing protein [Gammaproteobacteria bacterium]MBT5681883.1 HIT domain-containing protein [Gammaproteobacteria bacterium]MBT6025518.1 HIT domain-containing protein [Gammaproteobacteria bacterium]